MARRNDLAAAKQARQKKLAIAGFVVLLAVLALSVPKTLKMMKGPQVAAAPAAAPAAPASPTPATDVTAPVAVAELVDTGAVPQPTEGQLISFEQFDGKDPFAQQVEEQSAVPEASEPAAEPAAPAATAAEPAPIPSAAPAVSTPPLPEPSPAPAPAPATAQPTAPVAQPAPAPAPAPTSAVLSINGVRETVAVKEEFPAADKVFELRALGRNEVKVAIAGGSLTGGSQTVTLKQGKKVTLVNTADGTRYELVLVSLA